MSFLIEFTCARAPLTKPNAADIGFIAAIFFYSKLGIQLKKQWMQKNVKTNVLRCFMFASLILSNYKIQWRKTKPQANDSLGSFDCLLFRTFFFLFLEKVLLLLQCLCEFFFMKCFNNFYAAYMNVCLLWST